MDSVVSRSRSNSGLNFLSLLEKSYRAPPGSDYFVTTRELRERVTSAKNPPQCTIKALRSAPPFQNRNPDNYPMPYSREDVLKSAKGRRNDRQVRDTTNASVRVYSGKMRDYSKQMFDFAVVNANQNIPQNNNLNRTKENIDNHSNAVKWAKVRRRKQQVPRPEPDSKTNGPTSEGSILYNRRQKVLNTIRIRPKSECDGQYIHDRTASRPSLHETIMEKNQHFRVLNLNEVFHPGTYGGRTTSCSTDIVLVPVDNQITEKDKLFRERKFTESVTDTTDEVFSELQNTESRASTCDTYDDRDTIDGRKSHERSRLLPPSSTCNVRLVSLDEQSSSDSEGENEVAPPPPPPEPPKKQEQVKGPTKKNSKLTIPEPEPEVKPEKVKVILKGPKCWVDDATITSDESDHEDEPEVIESEPPAPQLKSLMKNVLNTKQNGGMLGKIALLKNQISVINKDHNKTNKVHLDKDIVKETPKPPTDPEPVLQGPVKEVTEPEPETEKPIPLPPFLCPSSERKSREAAIKDWLMNSCFHSASSGVPLI